MHQMRQLAHGDQEALPTRDYLHFDAPNLFQEHALSPHPPR